MDSLCVPSLCPSGLCTEKKSVLSTQKEGLCRHGWVWEDMDLTGLTLLMSCPRQVHNVAFAFELMLDGGLKKPKARPEGNNPLPCPSSSKHKRGTAGDQGPRQPVCPVDR